MFADAVLCREWCTGLLGLLWEKELWHRSSTPSHHDSRSAKEGLPRSTSNHILPLLWCSDARRMHALELADRCWGSRIFKTALLIINSRPRAVETSRNS